MFFNYQLTPFKSSKKRDVSVDKSNNNDKESSEPLAKKHKDLKSSPSDKSSPKTDSKPAATSSSASPKTDSKPATTSSSASKSNDSSGSKESFSTPVKTKKNKFFKKLKSSPGSMATKYCRVDATVPFKNEFSDKFEVIFGITFINEMQRGSDKHMFEARAPVFLKSLVTAYSTWDEDEFQFKIGSMSKLTEKILTGTQSSLRIRANPGSLNNDYLEFKTYSKYQSVLKMELDVKTMEEARQEVPKLIQELQQILSSPDWFLCYQISCYWEFVYPQDTTEVDDVLQELWEKAAGAKEDPDFAFIKNGLQKVFKDAMGRARGGLYGSLIVDAKNALRHDVGANPIVSTLNLKFDEFLMDEDIAVFVNQTFRQYSDETAVTLFKTQFDDRNMNNFF